MKERRVRMKKIKKSDKIKKTNKNVYIPSKDHDPYEPWSKVKVLEKFRKDHNLS